MMNGERRKGKEKANVEIHLSDIASGGIHIESDLSMGWLETRMSYCEYSATPESARVTMDVYPSGSGVLIRGHVDAVVKTLCGSCLKDIFYTLKSDITSYLLPLSEAGKRGNDEELLPEDLDREYFDGEIIALDDTIGDAIMLEMPMNPKCDGGCEGLQTFASPAGDVPDIDPRLAPLKGIRIKKEK